MESPLLVPSMLAADHTRLAEDIAAIERLGIKWIHIDIMDGHFVPNLSFGPQTVADLRPKSKLFFDVHLMLDNPQDYVEAFIAAGADQVSIHVEPSYDIGTTLEKVRSLGAKPGIVLNPRTEASQILPYLPYVDIVLAMTVQPGFGGQSFDDSVLEKTKQIDAYRSEHSLNFRLEVDGGINLDKARNCRKHGVDTFVAGTAFFRSDDQTKFLSEIESMF